MASEQSTRLLAELQELRDPDDRIRAIEARRKAHKAGRLIDTRVEGDGRYMSPKDRLESLSEATELVVAVDAYWS